MSWISCKDEYPVPYQTVIVHGGIAYCNGKTWYTLTGEQYPGLPIQWIVTHWMPLPEPPKEQP